MTAIYTPKSICVTITAQEIKRYFKMNTEEFVRNQITIETFVDIVIKKGIKEKTFEAYEETFSISVSELGSELYFVEIKRTTN